MMSFALVALVKATFVCGAAFVFARLCRRARASIRHLLFALAFVSLVVIPGAGLVLPTVAMTVPEAVTVPPGETRISLATPSGDVADPGGVTASSVRGTTSAPAMTIAQAITVAWLIGVALFLIPVVVGGWQVRRLREQALPWTGGQELVQTLAAALGVRRRIDALLHDEVTGPMTFGLVRPSIILPASAPRWDEASLTRALRHELEHIARWDFLTLCLSRVVCAVYWFHPLVWAAWRRLRLEAERACDDAVVARDDASDYASLLICMAEREPAGGRRPLLAMAGRRDLATRVAALLDRDQTRGRVGLRRASGLIVAAAIAMLVAAPITVARAMSQASQPSVPAKATSIKRSDGQAHITWRDGRLVASGVTMSRLLIMAYGVRDVVDAPAWVRFDRFDIAADLPSDFRLPEQGSKNLQAFLTERFKLKAHTGSREFPIYAMVLARRDGSLGPRLTRSTAECSTAPPCGLSTTHGRTTGRGVTMAALTGHLLAGSRTSGQVVDREIVDRTGLAGRFDFTVEWTPDSSSQTAQFRPYPSLLEANAPNLLAAFEEQLGLRVESQLAPKPVLIIDGIEQPAEN